MSRSNRNTTRSILLFLGSIALVTFLIASYTPEKKQTFSAPDKPTPTEYVYEPIYYEYRKGAWGTLPNDPLTGERGVQIDSARLETLKLAD